jgi:peroxiredoxin Q/BCP
VKRRQLLQGSSLAMLGLLGFPRQAFALGGTLPELDAPAPPFRLPAVLPDRHGAGVSGAESAQLALEDFRSRWLVLYFYPKDFTGGCTLEARGFQKDLEQFHARGAEVVGVSADEVEQHASFCDSEGLAFPLLSDPGGMVSRRYGSWIPPFSQRHSFLIDPEGVLRARWTAVRPSGHSREVLGELSRLQSAAPGQELAAPTAAIAS